MSENKGDLIIRASLLRHIGSVDEAKADAEADTELSESMKWLLVRCVEHATDIINAEPAVDAVGVVRCKDCKNKGMCCHHNGRYVGQFDDDDFCSYGERKEGTENGKDD